MIIVTPSELERARQNHRQKKNGQEGKITVDKIFCILIYVLDIVLTLSKSELTELAQGGAVSTAVPVFV